MPDQEPIIDVWIQHPTKQFLSDPMFAAIRRWLGMNEIPDFPLEWTLSNLNAAGIQRAILSAWHGPQGVLISNDEVASLVRQHPTRFIGMASVDLQRPMEAIRELRRSVHTLGLRGLRMLPWLWNRPPDDRLYYPLYAECIELGIPFCTQVGHAGPLCASEPGRPIPYLDQVAIDFPELKIVAGHIGYPWTDEMIALSTKYENVFIDTSAYKPRRFPQQLVLYMKTFGKKKVLFGSNYPMLMPADCLSQLDELDLSPEVRRLYLYENAMRIFG